MTHRTLCRCQRCHHTDLSYALEGRGSLDADRSYYGFTKQDDTAAEIDRIGAIIGRERALQAYTKGVETRLRNLRLGAVL